MTLDELSNALPMSLDDLSKAWNELRGIVMGRGTEKPAAVPQQLYERVGNAIERWQAWYPKASLLDQVAFQQTFPSWVTEYRELAAQANAAGLAVNTPGETSSETVRRVASDAVKAIESGSAHAGRVLSVLGLALGVPLVAVFVFGRKGRRGK